ncbi:MAG: sigma-70 family RNA polymerase sigma factor [Novosphingobium sp.]
MRATPSDIARLVEAIHRLGQGDNSALPVIYRATSAKLFGIILRILGDQTEAEDVLQDVYINLWQHAARFDVARASPISWLATFARNRAVDRLRRLTAQGAGRREPIEAADEVPDPAPRADDQLVAAGEAQALGRCIDALEARQREAIRAAWFDGLSYPDLAARAAVPLGTMKSWIRRGMIQLKECLER